MFLADQHELANAAQDCYFGRIAPYVPLGASRGDVIDTLCACLALADAIHSAHFAAIPQTWSAKTSNNRWWQVAFA